MRRLVVVVAAVMLAACSPVRLHEARALLEEIRAVGEGDLEARADTSVVRSPIAFAVDGRANAADLYLAEAAPRAGLVLVPGAARAGRDDPRLVAVAEALARAHFRVLVPDLEGLRALRITSADAPVLEAAAHYLAGDLLERPLGLVAISFAVGPAVLAIDAGAPVDFLVAIGGYWDLEATITFMTTGFYRDGPSDPWRYRQPDTYGRWVLVLSNVAGLADARDRALLEAMAWRRLADPGAAIDDLVGALGAAGRRVYALVANDDPERVPALIAALPPAVRAEIRALDLATVAADIWRETAADVDVVLVHGQGDPLIPETQSIAFARAVGPARARLYLVEGLRHVEPEGLGLAGSLTLLDATYRILTLRDARQLGF